MRSKTQKGVNVSKVNPDHERYFLAAIVDSSQDSVVSIDFNNFITSWNKAAEHLYGYPASEAVGKELSMVVLPQDLRQLFRNIDIIKHEGRVEIYETVRRHKDGHLMYLEVMLSPVKNESGTVIGVSTIARNITDRKIAEIALQKSESRFKGIVDQSTVGIFQTDVEGNFTLANVRTCNLLGYSADQLLGRSIFDFTFPEDVHLLREIFEDIVKATKRYECEKRMIRSGGSIVWVNESITAIFDPDGQPLSVIGILLDITERKRLEQQKDDFLAIASHEIKTPLTALKGYGQILETRINNSECTDLIPLIEKLNKQTDRLQHLVGTLLDSTRIAQGSLVLKREQFDMDTLIVETLDQFKTVSGKHELVFEKGSAGFVFADKVLVMEVLNNLISNAIKYSPEGGKVSVLTDRSRQEVKVTVVDEGIGISDTSAEQVFDRFYRSEVSVQHGIAGLGLGLYISAGIIRTHGGEICVVSKPGHGSAFSFTLPLLDPAFNL